MPNTGKDTQAIIAAIKRYVDGHINESVKRRNFRKRIQQRGETFDDYLVALRELVKTCTFCSPACTAKNIRDQIIEGILEGDTVEHLLQRQDLTLDTAITTCRAEEAAKKQQRSNALQFLSHHPYLTKTRTISQESWPSAHQSRLSRMWRQAAPRRPQSLPSLLFHVPQLSEGWPLCTCLPL